MNGRPLSAASRRNSQERVAGATQKRELGDVLKFGLDFTFVHEPAEEVELPTPRLLCFGECWLEADGDQLLFGHTTSAISEPPVLYYAHEGAPPKARPMAENFTKWTESIPKLRALRE